MNFDVDEEEMANETRDASVRSVGAHVEFATRRKEMEPAGPEISHLQYHPWST